MATSRPMPMGLGLDVDIETGMPVDIQQLARESQREQRRHEQQSQYLRLIDDLSGQGGEVMREVAARLATRIQQLIAEDSEARTLANLLTGVTTRLTAGERIVQDMLPKEIVASY